MPFLRRRAGRACAAQTTEWLLASELLTRIGFAARAADRVVVMARGRILADAAPAQAIASPVLAQAYGVDAAWIAGRDGPVLDIRGRIG